MQIKLIKTNVTDDYAPGIRFHAVDETDIREYLNLHTMLLASEALQ